MPAENLSTLEISFPLKVLNFFYYIIFQKLFGKYCNDLTLTLGHFIMHAFNSFELDKVFFHNKVNLENMQFFYLLLYIIVVEKSVAYLSLI